MNVRLHIERLVLEGISVAPDQRSLLQSAIEQELTRLLSAGGSEGTGVGINAELQNGGSLYSVRANQIDISSDSGPTEIGRQIAGAVYGGIAR